MRLKLFRMLAFSAIFAMSLTAACSKDSGQDMGVPDEGETTLKREIAKQQLQQDYSDYTISNESWSTIQGYEVVSFTAATRSANTPAMTVWYEVSDSKAERKLDTQYIGIEIPEVIREAFEATQYADDAKWRVDEIELDTDYVGLSTYRTTYEVELNSIGLTPAIEIELTFDATTGVLLFTKSEVDRDTNTFVVNEQLKAAVEKACPGAFIIKAEIDDNVIEVDAVLVENNLRQEIELEFSMNYVLLSQESEVLYTYGTLPTEFAAIKAWYENNTHYPAPAAETVVEVTTETENGRVKYEVEFEYFANGQLYEAEFELSSNYVITKAEVEIDD